MNDLRNENASLPATASTAMQEAVIRRLRTYDDYQACVALQQEIWGPNFLECVPPAILMASQKIGGVTAGAFDANGKLLGFVFGMTGVKDGRLVHWSDMLAVRQEARDHGLGQRLKQYQKELVSELGVEVIYWTYDPLVARNAHLNLNRLGARISEYVQDMYGDDMAGELNRGLGTDRFVVEWDISKNHTKDHVEFSDMQRFTEATIVNTKLSSTCQPAPIKVEFQKLPAVRVEIPQDIQLVKSASLSLAAEWRAVTRHALMFYLDSNYQVLGFYREEKSKRCFYVMIPKTCESIGKIRQGKKR